MLTPAGILTLMVRVDADPAVAGALHARVGDDGAVAAAGRARLGGPDVADERALHVGDVALPVAGRAAAPAASPPLAPEPLQRGQSTAVSTRSGLVVPKAASASSRSSRTRASWPRRTRRPRAAGVCWPNIASTRLVKSKPPAPEAAVEAAAHAAAERVAAAVVEVALLGVLQHLVRLGDLLEPLGRIRLLATSGCSFIASWR